MKNIYEKLGLFYLGKAVDRETMQTTEALTLCSVSWCRGDLALFSGAQRD